MTAFYEGADTFDSETLWDGLQIGLTGAGWVFVLLVVLAAAIKLMERIDSRFPADAPSPATARSAPRPRPAPAATQPAPAVSADPDAQTAAAIGVALALAELEGRSKPVTQRPSAQAGWVQSGRARQLRGWDPGARRGRQG